MTNFFDQFRLQKDREDLELVISNIDKGVVFRGTNLWILIFAIFVASLGLNVNSTAVIIGAMLISPLMGPIMGIGLGIGINDVALLRKSFHNYFIAAITALTTSTVFFLISPLNDAHSEILARTSPNIYDVLIAIFGGLAGIVATCSRQKGNVIPGVAIATALMPPLCTAGYGLATLQLKFFIGAFYLFIINTVFIALATFIIVRLLQFPYKELHNKRSEQIAHRIIWAVVLITFIPSLYFGYDMVQQDRFTKKATLFIANEAHFTNDYLLNKRIDAKKKLISLVFGGKEIVPAEISQLKAQLKKYQLDDATLEINQGFAYLNEEKANDQSTELKQLTLLLNEKQHIQDSLRARMDSVRSHEKMSFQIFSELKVRYPELKGAIVQPSTIVGDSARQQPTFLVMLFLNSRIVEKEKKLIQDWLKVRLNREVHAVFQP